MRKKAMPSSSSPDERSVVAAALGALRIRDRKTRRPDRPQQIQAADRHRISDVRARRRNGPIHRGTSSVHFADGRGPRDVQDGGRERRASIICSDKVRAKAYDAVINGYECAGRLDPYPPKRSAGAEFQSVRDDARIARVRSSDFSSTPSNTARRRMAVLPPGIERTCMILCGTENIRDVMAFPKTASAQDLMMDSPGSCRCFAARRTGDQRHRRRVKSAFLGNNTAILGV